MAEMSTEAVDSLVTKIEGLDLSDGEVGVLDALLDAAEQGAGVEGFAFKSQSKNSGLPGMRGRVIDIIFTRDDGHEEQ